MAPALPLRAALKRGALLTAANWPVVLVEFAIESLFKLTLAVPLVGGAFMVAVLFGADIRTLMSEGVRSSADIVVSSLMTAPAALSAFLVAVGLVAAGGELLVVMVKSGTLSILVSADRHAGEVQRPPARMEAFRRAQAFGLGALVAGVQQFARRSARLAAMVVLAYAVVGGCYVLIMTWGFQLAAESSLVAAWPLLLLAATSTGVVAISAIGLAFDLTRVVMVTDDCGVADALARVRVFLVADARQVLGIFAVMIGVFLLGTVAALTATGWLTVLSWVPLAGVLFVPLQAAAWIIRGLLFTYLGLTALSAYQTQYRRFAEPARIPASPPFRIHQA